MRNFVAYFFIILFAVSYLPTFQCSRNSGDIAGNSSGASFVGQLFTNKIDTKSETAVSEPASGVMVNLRSYNYIPEQFYSHIKQHDSLEFHFSTITDAQGMFRFDSIPIDSGNGCRIVIEGTEIIEKQNYSVLIEKEFFCDAVSLRNNQLITIRDTLKATRSISGVFNHPDSSIPVPDGVIVLGLDKYVDVNSSTGEFNLPNLPQGTLRLIFFNTNADNSLENMRQVNIGVNDTILDTLYSIVYHDEHHTTGTVPIDGRKYFNGESATIIGNIGDLARSEYTFLEWNTASDGSGISYSPGDTLIMSSMSITLYATWTENSTACIIFRGNGNSSGTPPASISYLKNTSITIIGNVGLGNSDQMQRDGYSFIGWKTEPDGDGIGYPVGATFKIDASDTIILYAWWTKDPVVHLEYDGNGQTSGKVPVDNRCYRFGDIITVSENFGKLARQGSVFVGWRIKSEDHDTVYAPNSTVLLDSSIANMPIFYAQWRENPTYTIIYDGNNNTAGDAPSDDNRYSSGTYGIVLGNNNNLEKEGLFFNGWNTAADGSGDNHLPGTKMKLDSADIVLYAQWKIRSGGLIRFIPGTGTVTGGDSLIIGVPDTIIATCPKDSHFVEWRVKSGEIHFDDSTRSTTTVTLNSGEAAIEAVCECNEYDLTILKEGNGAVTGAGKVNPGPPGSIIQAKPTEGSSFIVWRTVSGTPAIVDSTAPITFLMLNDGDATIKGIFAVNKYKITYISNCQTSDPVKRRVDYTFNDSVITPENDFSDCYGYSFTGWNSNADGTGDSYTPGNIFLMSAENMELFAQWAVDTFTVTFDSRGGNDVAIQKIPFSEKITPPADPSRHGYTFDGWYIDTVFASSWQFTHDQVEHSLVLYAKWSINRVNIAYDGNGSTNGVIPDSLYDFDTDVLVASHGDLSREGYLFNGWNSKADGSGQAFAEGSTFRIDTAAVTLYAQWRYLTGMVRIPANGFTFSMGSDAEDAQDDEKPPHSITFSKDYYIDTNEITQQQYDSLMEATYDAYHKPSWSDMFGAGDDFPVYYVNWYDAVLFCNARTMAAGRIDTVYSYTSISGNTGYGCILEDLNCDLTMGGFRLPTEAEWEFACRGGSTTRYFWGDDTAGIDKYVWYRYNSDSVTHAVGQKEGNQYGLHDIVGNVWEWCNDWYTVYDNSMIIQYDPTGPQNPSTGINERVVRSGSIGNNLAAMRPVDRYSFPPDSLLPHTGFRTCIRNQ